MAPAMTLRARTTAGTCRASARVMGRASGVTPPNHVARASAEAFSTNCAPAADGADGPDGGGVLLPSCSGSVIQSQTLPTGAG